MVSTFHQLVDIFPLQIRTSVYLCSLRRTIQKLTYLDESSRSAKVNPFTQSSKEWWGFITLTRPCKSEIYPRFTTRFKGGDCQSGETVNLSHHSWKRCKQHSKDGRYISLLCRELRSSPISNPGINMPKELTGTCSLPLIHFGKYVMPCGNTWLAVGSSILQ